jgi:hypothetical protein
MCLHKWNINHMSNYNIYFDPKFWNRKAVKFVNPPKSIGFFLCHLLPLVFGIYKGHQLSYNKLQSTPKAHALKHYANTCTK